MSFGTTLKLIRIFQKVKQKDLAKRLGVSPNYISLIENEKREPSLSFIKTVSSELDIPVGFLFLGESDDQSLSVQQRAIYSQIKKLLMDFQALKDEEKEESSGN